MHVIGRRAPGAVPSEAAGNDYPLVIRGDAVLCRLLYLRERWGLPVDEGMLSDLGGRAVTESDGVFLEHQWVREWRHAWACLDAAHVAWSEGRQPEGLPDVRHSEWFAVDEFAGYASSEYQEWLSSRRGAAAGSEFLADGVSAQAAVAAAGRGLVGIVVVPLDGAWSGRTRHLVGVSPMVLESSDLLRDALRLFE